MQARTESEYQIVIDRQRYSLEASKKGWKTNALAAEALGFSEPTLSKLLSGKIEPSAKTIDRLLTELDLPYRALFIRKELS
ncbi:helix-turn-helix transcriptional regulator [Glycomyces sp. NPDC021274]|uniref:helix-turn-helix transcriptional regulator n=1 Tax=Glycomyces sp. NPDC021274 TaxID=3155120 RepID=UPI0033D9508B